MDGKRLTVTVDSPKGKDAFECDNALLVVLDKGLEGDLVVYGGGISAAGVLTMMTQAPRGVSKMVQDIGDQAPWPFGRALRMAAAQVAGQFAEAVQEGREFDFDAAKATAEAEKALLAALKARAGKPDEGARKGEAGTAKPAGDPLDPKSWKGRL